MRVDLSAFIANDIDTIAEFIAEDNPARAISFIGEIRAKFAIYFSTLAGTTGSTTLEG